MRVRSGKGDKGYTDLAFKDIVDKDSPDVRALGALDELMSFLGLAKVKISKKKYKMLIERMQTVIGTIASELAVGPEKKKELGELVKEQEVAWINKEIFHLESYVRITPCFYLPGSNEVSAILDIARAVARRAERDVVTLFHKNKLKNGNILPFLNCVSDILFIIGREEASRKKKTKKKRAEANEKTI